MWSLCSTYFSIPGTAQINLVGTPRPRGTGGWWEDGVGKLRTELATTILNGKQSHNDPGAGIKGQGFKTGASCQDTKETPFPQTPKAEGTNGSLWCL